MNYIWTNWNRVTQDVSSKNYSSVRWKYWNSIIVSKSIVKTLFEIDINGTIIQSKEKQENEAKFNGIVKNLNRYQKSKILEDFSCPIWFSLINMKVNLQWLSWRHTFWFQWLIQHLVLTDKWPCWREFITVKSLNINKSIISSLDLLVEVGKSTEIEWSCHLERCDLYWKLWEIAIWSKWILLGTHATHELTSLIDMINETYNKWVKICQKENLITKKIENRVKDIWDSKALLDFISNEPIIMLQKIMKDYIIIYNNKISNSYNDYIKGLNKSLKKSIENNNKIGEFTKSCLKTNTINVVESIKDQETIEKEIDTISDKFQESIKTEHLISFDTPIKTRFRFKTDSLIKNEEIQMENMNKESKIWSLLIIKKDWEIWDIVIRRIDKSDINYFAKISSLSENAKFIDINKISKLEAKSKIVMADNLELTQSINYIEVELNLWIIKKDIEEYIQSSKGYIKEVLKDMINFL